MWVACLELLAVAMLEVAVVGLRREVLKRLQARGDLVQMQCLGRQVVERQL